MWDDLKPSQVEIPITSIRIIANELNSITKQALIFSPETDVYHEFPDIEELTPLKPEDDSRRVNYLKVYVPNLNGYTLYLISVINDIRLIYPCVVKDIINDKKYEVNSYEELDSIIRTILSDAKIKGVISNLWAQAIK